MILLGSGQLPWPLIQKADSAAVLAKITLTCVNAAQEAEKQKEFPKQSASGRFLANFRSQEALTGKGSGATRITLPLRP